MSQTITIAKFKDVSEGLQPGQFAIGDREIVNSLDSLDPIYKELLDRPITITLGLIGPDGRVSLTPMWFDYEGDHVLVNTAAHRSKCGWIRNNPELTILVVNPDNPYHWVQIKCTVEREELEEDRNYNIPIVPEKDIPPAPVHHEEEPVNKNEWKGLI